MGRALGWNDRGMRAYLLTAPRWVLSLLHGLPFGFVLATAILWDRQASAQQIIGLGLVSGLVYGVGVAFAGEKERREVRTVIGDASPDRLRTVCRASRRGPVPADPEVRASSLRLARHDAAKAQRGLILAIPFGLLLTVAAVTKINESPVLILVAALFPVTLAYQVFATRRLKQRVELLG